MATPLITRPSGVNDPGLLEAPWWATSLPMRRPEIDAIIARLVTRRAEAEYLAERLIEALNEADGDPDLEEDCDVDIGIDDLPHDEEPDKEDGGDGEPLLGSFDRHIDQRVAWATRGINLCPQEPELDRSDYEPNGDEMDGFDDNGIADNDGTAEQWGAIAGYAYV